ncbi:MAG: hypothetical protein HY866_06320 [Chloroflexi bacterium]|nr:hypothetical protein [Chloroflexota bacterium]
MAPYKLFHPDHEYLGQVLMDFQNAVEGESIHSIFKKHGLTNIQPQAWYPAQMFINILNDMKESRTMQMLDFVSIGMKQVENAVMPPGLAQLPLIDILRSMDTAYQMNNRGTDIGEIRCEVIDAHHVRLIFRVPQPDDIWYGVCYGYMRRLAPEGTHFTVYYDEHQPRREDGGEITIIHISWS